MLPSCVPACPRSKCQQNLGTWSGIWCHIARRTRIQKTSQHGELTWSAAKPAATHQLSATAPVKCPFGCAPARITASLTHAHTLNPQWHRGDDKETEGPRLAELLPAPSTYCTAPYLTPEPYCISIPSVAAWQRGLHTNRVCVNLLQCCLELPGPGSHMRSLTNKKGHIETECQYRITT